MPPGAAVKGSPIIAATSSTIGGENQLVVASPHGGFAEVIVNNPLEGKMIMKQVQDAGGIFLQGSGKGGGTIGGLTDILNAAGKKYGRFDVITIEGHCGGNDRMPGALLVNPETVAPSEEVQELTICRFDLAGLKHRYDPADKNSAAGREFANLLPLKNGGVLRVVSCGYRGRGKWAGPAGKQNWEAAVDGIAKFINDPDNSGLPSRKIWVVFSTGDIYPAMVTTSAPFSANQFGFTADYTKKNKAEEFGGWYATNGPGTGFWIPAFGEKPATVSAGVSKQ